MRICGEEHINFQNGAGIIYFMILLFYAARGHVHTNFPVGPILSRERITHNFCSPSLTILSPIAQTRDRMFTDIIHAPLLQLTALTEITMQLRIASSLLMILSATLEKSTSFITLRRLHRLRVMASIVSPIMRATSLLRPLCDGYASVSNITIIITTTVTIYFACCDCR